MTPVELVLSAIGGTSVAGAIVGAGVLKLWVEPAIDKRIAAHEALAATQEARKAAAREVLTQEANAREGAIVDAIRGVAQDLQAPLSAAVDKLTAATLQHGERTSAQQLRVLELLERKTAAVEAVHAEQSAHGEILRRLDAHLTRPVPRRRRH